MSVSIVMATYNGAQYIVEQLDSIICQLKSGDEIIICDDCSTDDTVPVIKKYIFDNKLEELISVYENEVNLGFQNNFNKAMSYAKKDYIFFSDQDDVWLPDKISKMLEIMRDNSDCKLLCCDYEPWFINSDGKAPKEILEKMPNNEKLEKIVLSPKSIYIGQLGCCMCIKKEFADFLGEYWFDGWAQDDRCWRMALISDGLYIYHKNFVMHRIHDNNTATYGKYHSLEKRIKLFESMRDADNQMLRYLENNPDTYKNNLLHNNRDMMNYRIEMMKKGNPFYLFKLLPYLKYYQKKKSFLVDFYITIKGK